jgi:hypothetical protein
MGSAKGWRGPCAPFPLGSAYYLRDLDRLLTTTWHPDTLAWETHSVPWIEQIIAQAPRQDR